jgi:hypothetical protein
MCQVKKIGKKPVLLSLVVLLIQLVKYKDQGRFGTLTSSSYHHLDLTAEVERSLVLWASLFFLCICSCMLVRISTWEVLGETTRISANGFPNLSTSVVVPGGLPRAIPVSAIPKSIQKGKSDIVEYNIYFITIIRVHLFGTCRVQVQQDWIKHK